jgi:zinc protease
VHEQLLRWRNAHSTRRRRLRARRSRVLRRHVQRRARRLPSRRRSNRLTRSPPSSKWPVSPILRRVGANYVVAANLYLLGGARQLDSNTGPVLLNTERGTAKYPRDVLRNKMALLGSAIGISPGVDWTVIGLRSTVANFDSTWAILADRLIAPTLNPAEVELVREQFVTGVRQRKDSPDALLNYLSDSIAFAGHPYALDVIGTEATLSKFTVADLKAYRAEQLVTSRMLLVVVGNVSRTKVEKLVRESIGRLPRGAYTWSLPTAPAEL